jgi:hypothetical protein
VWVTALSECMCECVCVCVCVFVCVCLCVCVCECIQRMEEHALKNVNNCFNTNIYTYLETSGGQSSNLYLNVVHFFNTSVN